MSMNTRAHERERVLLPAKIIFNNKQSIFDCVVKDISSGGARLSVTSCLGIPDHFMLLIPFFDKRYPCWIIWSEMNEIGISFAPRERNEGQPDLRVV